MTSYRPASPLFCLTSPGLITSIRVSTAKALDNCSITMFILADSLLRHIGLCRSATACDQVTGTGLSRQKPVAHKIHRMSGNCMNTLNQAPAGSTWAPNIGMS